MNDVKLKDGLKKDEQVLCGDIYLNRGMSGIEFFIVARVDDKYVAISLTDGEKWDYECENAERAVEGLEFVGRGLKIEIRKAD